jgi:hypothetical protein
VGVLNGARWATGDTPSAARRLEAGRSPASALGMTAGFEMR